MITEELLHDAFEKVGAAADRAAAAAIDAGACRTRRDYERAHEAHAAYLAEIDAQIARLLTVERHKSG